MCRSTNRSRGAGPEIWFRIVHATVPRQNGVPLAAYREQEVEVAFGPIGVIEDCDVGTLMRRIDTDRVVSVVPMNQRNLKPPVGPKTPRVTELLRKALEWRRQLDYGELRNQAEIARREGITRARVTQIMALLRLAPENLEHILTMPKTVRQPEITERKLRPIINGIEDTRQEEPIRSLMP